MDLMHCLKLLHQRLSSEDIPPLPPAKIFKPKHNLPLLKNYRKPAPSEFWDNFPTNLVQPSKSMVDPYLLRKLDLETKFVDLVLLDTIHNDLLHATWVAMAPPDSLLSQLIPLVHTNSQNM